MSQRKTKGHTRTPSIFLERPLEPTVGPLNTFESASCASSTRRNQSMSFNISSNRKRESHKPKAGESTMSRQFHSSLKLVDVAKKINLKKETSSNQ